MLEVFETRAQTRLEPFRKDTQSSAGARHSLGSSVLRHFNFTGRSRRNFPAGQHNLAQRDLARESEMSDFVTVCQEVDLPAGAIRKVEVQGQTIVLYNVGGKLYATQQECLHRQGPLDEGELQGTVITCPWHGWQYDVTTGENLGNRGSKLKTYAVRTAGGEVQVAL